MAQKAVLEKIGEIIPQGSVLFFLLCLAGLIVFVFAGTVSSYKTVLALESEASALKSAIQETNYLKPVRQSVMGSLQEKTEWTLPLPEKKPLPRGESAQIFSSISDLADKSGMRLVKVIPDATLLAGDSEFLPVDISVSGSFNSFRGLLAGLGGLPYLDDVEGIEIIGHGKGMEYNVSLRLALGK